MWARNAEQLLSDKLQRKPAIEDNIWLKTWWGEGNEPCGYLGEDHFGREKGRERRGK
jgi:hypothetical protein